MRILLTSNAPYLPPRGGSTRSNLAYLKALTDRGHAVRVIAAAPEDSTPAQQKQLCEELAEQHLTTERPVVHGVEIVSVRDLVRHAQVLDGRVREFEPDWVLVSSEDLSHGLLAEAARVAPGRLIYIAHTPQFFPFGPASWHPDESGTRAARAAAAIIVISYAMAEYVDTYLGVKATVIHPPIYGDDPQSDSAKMLGDFDHGYIAMINPCQVKGISLFLAIADALPHQHFAVLPGWGTTQDDLANLKRRVNIAVLGRVRDIDQFLSRVKILLMPSLWLEGFGLIAMEAMLRGVPVVASDSGGLREAKAGTNYLMPVELIEHYEPTFDERHMPRPILPVESIEPWVKALRDLSSDRSRYQQEAALEKATAEEFVSSVDRLAIERFLLGLKPTHHAPTTGDRELSEARQRLLWARLKSRQVKS